MTMAKGPCKPHGMIACSQCVVIEPAAQRMAGIINLIILSQAWDVLIHGCMAFRLDDGTSDLTIYPDRKTALTYQLRPSLVFHFRNTPGGVNAFDCQIFLNIHREAYENDRIAWTDPESPDLIVSTYGADRMRRQN